MSTAVIAGYEEAIADLPEEAFLGRLLWFSISAADVNLEQARTDLDDAGLSTTRLRKLLRPVDAFKKSTREFGHKFPVRNGVRSELMVRPVGEDGEQAHRHLILERVVMQAGRKRRVFYEKVGEIVFTRGKPKRRNGGEYSGYGVEARRTTDHLATPLTAEEDAWLSEMLDGFEGRFQHLIENMDSNAVRAFVREFISEELMGTCVKESGGLYFVSQDFADQVEALGEWVRSIGSQFHALPLLNLGDQRAMVLQSLEEETVKEVDILMGQIGKILGDPDRKIEEKTFDAFGLRAAELTQKLDQYAQMLGVRAEEAQLRISVYGQQVMQLSQRIRQSSTMTAKGDPTT